MGEGGVGGVGGVGGRGGEGLQRKYLEHMLHICLTLIPKTLVNEPPKNIVSHVVPLPPVHLMVLTRPGDS